jgi:serine/threonine protein phosphatase PrpC
MGDANVRLLDLEGRIAPVDQLLAVARKSHRTWIEETFAPVLPARGARREELVMTLYAATDVTVWKLLRRDLGRSRRQTEAVIRNLVAGATASVTHVGDGRVWLVRGQEVRQVTHDHTVVAALLESGQLTADEARSHPHRSLLNRALVPGVVTDDLEVRLQPGDRLVLTTDGVHSHVEDLTSLLVSPVPAQQLADEVGDVVAASGEPDNHTIVVVDLT